ncbi:MAG TPA: hypothetical protein VMW48_15780, partial [Vicinamibacterales bacterium]|nr:hypothetical protein [Vicinamibacterales bacterium]
MATTYLRTFPVKKEQSYLLKAAGSVSKGNGRDRHMPLGRDGNGDKFRGAMQFSLDFSNIYQIKQAVLVFKSTQETHVTFGAGPTVQAQRISATWPSGGGSEGNWGTPAGVWPGPGVTGSTYTWGPGDTATGVKRRLDITTLVDQWAPATVLQSSGAAGAAAANYGLRLVAPDEGTTADRYEIHGLRATYAGQRPYIELWYSTDKPPLKPVITAPESDDPAYYASTNANVFYLDFLFSDPDQADTCARTALEVYGDAATDGAPGTLVAGWQPAPTPLGPLNAYRVGIYSAAFVPRTNYRYRLATMDQEATWGPYTPLDEGRIQMVYKVSPPAQLLMTGGLDEPHIYGSLVSADPTDYIGGYDAEVYRDTDAGAIALWSTGQTNVTTSATRQDLTYGGESLRDGEIVRWHLRLANRDGQWSEWSPWQYTEMVATEGPDACSPADTSTKLTTRTPELTIAHSSDFDGWRYRLYRDGSEIYDSGETAIADTSSTAQTVPADILAWGDGSDSDVPLEWEAQISTVASGAYGPWSPTYAIRINALPAADLTMTPEPSAS